MDYLARESADLSAELWNRIDDTVIGTARKQLACRRFLKVFGPLGPGATTVAVDGVGKEEIVRRLHALSEKRDGDLIVVDVSRGTKKYWEALLNHPNSPLNRMDCNIFFKNIQEIPEYACDPFEEYIASIAAGDRVRLYS